MSRLSDLPPGVSVMNENINPSDPEGPFCPHCGDPLQPLRMTNVWGCEDCKETWHLAEGEQPGLSREEK
jgi:hypothetical protein